MMKLTLVYCNFYYINFFVVVVVGCPVYPSIHKIYSSKRPHIIAIRITSLLYDHWLLKRVQVP